MGSLRWCRRCGAIEEDQVSAGSLCASCNGPLRSASDPGPQDRVVAAMHEAAHAVVAASAGLLPNRVAIAGTPDGRPGVCSLKCDERLTITGIARRISSADAAEAWAARHDALTMASIYLASLVVHRVRGLEHDLAYADDVMKAGEYLDAVFAKADEGTAACWALQDEIERLLTTPSGSAALEELAARLLEKSEIGADDVARACSALRIRPERTAMC